MPSLDPYNYIPLYNKLSEMKSKQHFGQLLEYDPQTQMFLEQQSLKFKKSCLRKKSLLFENNFLQFGILSRDFKEESYFGAKINLFVTNQAASPVQVLSLQYSVQGECNLQSNNF